MTSSWHDIYSHFWYILKTKRRRRTYEWWLYKKYHHQHKVLQVLQQMYQMMYQKVDGHFLNTVSRRCLDRQMPTMFLSKFLSMSNLYSFQYLAMTKMKKLDQRLNCFHYCYFVRWQLMSRSSYGHKFADIKSVVPLSVRVQRWQLNCSIHKEMNSNLKLDLQIQMMMIGGDDHLLIQFYCHSCRCLWCPSCYD